MIQHYENLYDDFFLKETTVWSFPDHGDWATHNSKWRGNWTPNMTNPLDYSGYTE